MRKSAILLLIFIEVIIVSQFVFAQEEPNKGSEKTFKFFMFQESEFFMKSIELVKDIDNLTNKLPDSFTEIGSELKRLSYSACSDYALLFLNTSKDGPPASTLNSFREEIIGLKVRLMLLYQFGLIDDEQAGSFLEKIEVMEKMHDAFGRRMKVNE